MASAIRPKETANMTQGSIARHLLKFAFPLLLGNLFQQLYNTVDTWVVGNFASNEAFSAVGSVASIINVLIGLFMGLSTGAGTVIAQFYGAKHHERVKDAVHTSIMLTLVLSVVFTIVGITFTPGMLRLTKMPANVMPEATTYLRIYFAGITGLLFYNMGAAVLRSVGDSRRPFQFLVVSAVINSVLDLVFVVVFRMGVAGVALATILAQGISATLVVRSLIRSQDCIRLELRHLKIHWDVLKKVFRVGIPAALQLAVTSFSNVFVQSYINHFGHHFMSGWTAYTKINQIVILPMQSLSLSVTTFVGQNLGAGLPARAKKSVGTAFAMSAGTAIVLMIPVMVFAPRLVGFFNPNEEVIAFGSLLLRTISPFYLVYCVHDTLGGALRGAGNGKVPMIVTLVCMVGFRQVYLYVMANYICNEVIPIAFSFPAGWILSASIVLVYFLRTDLSSTKLVDNN